MISQNMPLNACIYTHMLILIFQPFTKQRGCKMTSQMMPFNARIYTHMLIVLFQSCTKQRGLQNDITEDAIQCSYLHTYAYIYFSAVHKAKRAAK